LVDWLFAVWEVERGWWRGREVGEKVEEVPSFRQTPCPYVSMHMQHVRRRYQAGRSWPGQSEVHGGCERCGFLGYMLELSSHDFTVVKRAIYLRVCLGGFPFAWAPRQWFAALYLLG
jgi:hypothetical protein